MVQHKEDEEKSIANGEIKTEVCESEITNGENVKINGHASEGEESDDDDYLDHLLMLPPLDGDFTNRNKNLVSKTLLDLCTAIESRKEYHKIRRELLLDSAPIDSKKDVKPDLDLGPPNLNANAEITIPTTTVDPNEVSQENEYKVPETRRHSVRLRRAIIGELQTKIRQRAFIHKTLISVPEHDPSINDQFFVCRRCTIFFQTRKLRKEHNLLNHRRKINGVPVVNGQQKHRLRRSSLNKDPFTCDVCQKQFKQKSLLRSHMNSHQSEPQFFCPLCPYASKRNSDLKKHNDMHHNPDRIAKVSIRKRKCGSCEEVLNGKKALKIHMREKHPQELPAKKIRIVKRQCEKCEEVLEGAKAYRIHLKLSHSEAIVIRCETCHRKFKTNFRLKKHQNKYGKLPPLTSCSSNHFCIFS